MSVMLKPAVVVNWVDCGQVKLQELFAYQAMLFHNYSATSDKFCVQPFYIATLTTSTPIAVFNC